MIKRITLIILTLVLLGGSVEAVGFLDAMQKGHRGSDGIFPSWNHGGSVEEEASLPRIEGVIGTKKDGEDGKTEKLLMHYVPHLIDILLKFVAPLIMVAMIFAGLRFVYAGSNEDELSQAKQIFTYTLMGVAFVVLSYSILKALYFLLSK
jgi:hypothetical protein